MQNLQLHSRKDMAFISIHGEDQNVYGCDTFGPLFPIHDEESQNNFIGEWFLLKWKLCSYYMRKFDGKKHTTVQAMVDGNNEKIGHFIIL